MERQVKNWASQDVEIEKERTAQAGEKTRQKELSLALMRWSVIPSTGVLLTGLAISFIPPLELEVLSLPVGPVLVLFGGAGIVGGGVLGNFAKLLGR